nr:probable transmembrane ascorbate ferrireductase 4 [Tanacetum cinerariifolium]
MVKFEQAKTETMRELEKMSADADIKRSEFDWRSHWLMGFLSFWHRGEVRMTRIHVLPWHVFLGLYTYGLAVVTAETGHLEKLTFLQTKGVVFKRCTDTRTVGEALASSKRGQCSYLSPTGSKRTKRSSR